MNTKQQPEFQIDPKLIECELQELTGNERVSVKLDKHIPVRVSIYQTDVGIENRIRLNPNKIRSQATLDAVLNVCRQAVVN